MCSDCPLCPPALHIGQAVYFRLWFLFPTAVLCGIGEVIGWSGRLWASFNVLNRNAFLMQCVTLYSYSGSQLT
jgi:hypothetical protein